MAYYRQSRGSGRRSAPRRASRRTSYGSRAVRRPARRRASTRRSSAGPRTIRIEVVQSSATAARPEIGMKVAAAPRTRSTF